MKLLKKINKCFKQKNLGKTLLLLLLLFLLVKYFMKSCEGFGGEQKTLLFVHMNGCGHCETLMPEWDKFVNENETNIKTRKVETKTDPTLANKYKIEGYPTILLLGSNGEKLDTYDGERTSDALLDYVKENDT